MRPLEMIIRNNEAAAKAEADRRFGQPHFGHSEGPSYFFQEGYNGGGSLPPPPAPPTSEESEIEAALGPPSATGSPKVTTGPERVINVLQMTVVHDVGRGIMAGTISYPYIEQQDDPALTTLGHILLNEFGRVTAPPEPGTISEVWGEYCGGPGEDKEAQQYQLRLPSPKSLIGPQDC